ncbi:hypothetical protein D3C81_364340 [compost metagenome]
MALGVLTKLVKYVPMLLGLGDKTDATKGASTLGYFPGYPGAGLEGGDVASILSERVSIKRFGVSSANNGTVNTDKFQKALIAAAANGFIIELPWEFYNVTFAGPLFVDYTMITDQRGVSIVGHHTRRNRIIYTGSGHFLSVLGLGTEDNTPITQFELSNFRVSAQNNATPVGAIHLDRVNRARLFGISCDSFANPASRIIEIRNYFNVDLEKFNISGGASLPQGQYGLVYGSKNSGAGDEWNSSNLKVHNGLIQRMAGKGAVLIHDGNICDNVQFEHVSFGSNSLGSLSNVSSNMRNLAVQNCHFESAGKQPNGTFVGATHINVALITGLEIKNNDMKDAQIHGAIDQVKGFDIGLNNVSESGVYTIDNSIGFKVTGISSNQSAGRIANNNVYTTQIDEPYTTDSFSSVDPGTHEVTEGAWSSVYASKPGYYGKNLLLRKELNLSNVDGQFDQVWLSPQSQWLRVMLSTRHVGWGTTFPTTGSYTQGDIVLNESPAIVNTGTPYTTLGWRRLTTGSAHVAGTDWVGLRCLTGAVAFTSSYNGTEPLKLGGYYLWVDASARLRIKSGAPTSDTDGTIVGTQT